MATADQDRLTATYAARIRRASHLARQAGIDALLISPGSDLRYLIGYEAKPLERLTCLVIPAHGEPVLVAPRLELLAAQDSPAEGAGVSIRTWGETDDPYALTASLIGAADVLAVDGRMWADKTLAFRDAMPSSRLITARQVIEEMRIIKDAAEIAELQAAGAAIDSVHAQVPGLLRAGRTEREVGARIADLITQAGHVQVDFVIVASGPNAASPHHDVSDRPLAMGDCVVVDIGGMLPTGYRSDCTRTYHLGAPSQEYADRYAALQEAQQLAVEHVRAGVTCESVDEVARAHLRSAGIDGLFIHRIGHGIGLESHEEPYMVSGNARLVEPGMAFSIEPGFYDEGRHGARIEDIVIATDDGCIVVNHQPHELVIA